MNFFSQPQSQQLTYNSPAIKFQDKVPSICQQINNQAKNLYIAGKPGQPTLGFITQP